MQTQGLWFHELDAAITVCDQDGIVLEMNEKACQIFAEDGGSALIGKNLLDCHPEPAKSKLVEMMKNQSVNCYTIEKKGIKKMIYQSPWFEKGAFKGFVEISMQIPWDMPHFVRKSN